MTPTPEQVAAWAREAGMSEHDDYPKPLFAGHDFNFRRFAALACAWQAEQDAKLCAEQYHKHIGPEYGEVRYGIAACEAAIRASVKGGA